MVVFKIRDSVPSASYSSVCNVLRQWSISLIPTYRVYLLYDIAKIQAIEHSRKLTSLAIIYSTLSNQPTIHTVVHLNFFFLLD